MTTTPAPEEFLSRRSVRHALVRARNARVVADRDERYPLLLAMSNDTLSELLVDADPHEAHVLDFEGREFMGIPILTDDDLERGLVEIRWPA